MNRLSVTPAPSRGSSSAAPSARTGTISLTLLLAGSLLAGGISMGAFAPLTWDNPEVFSPEIFPERDQVSETEIFFSGLEALFPRRVFRERPVLDAGPDREPQSHTLVPSVPYIRVYNLESALPLIEEKGRESTLVIDLRYVEADLDSSLALGSFLAREGSLIEIVAIGDHPVVAEGRGALQVTGLRVLTHPFFVLTNGKTAGPIEAVLSALKENGHIISVGAPTAGKTGSFQQVSENPSLYVMNGEIRSDPAVSLVETGFVPAVLSRTAPEEDRAGYQALENGVSIERLVQPQLNRARFDEAQQVREFNNEDPVQEADEATGIPPDPTLQRVYHIVKALQSLGNIPGGETEN
ncbi:MAG: hypothetical protein WD490_01235 [Opitutales bacterium]